MEDKIRLDFLLRVNQMAEELMRERFRIVELNFEKELPGIVEQLADQTASVLEQYQAQQEAGENGGLKWVYFSFLRSSILDDFPVYRIDLYDERDQISEQECAGTWGFEYLFQHLWEICHQLQTEFASQSRVKEYELDAVVYHLAEQFKKEAEKLIPEILKRFLETYGAEFFGVETVKFRLGELFDASELIIEWKTAKSEPDERETDK